MAETHQAFVGESQINGRKLTIAEWSALKPIKTLRIQHGAVSFGDDITSAGKFATDQTCRWGWYLVKRSPVPLVGRGFRLDWQAFKKDLATRGYEPLSAVEEITRFILFTVKGGGQLPTWVTNQDTVLFPDRTALGELVAVRLYGWASDPPKHQLLFNGLTRNHVNRDSDLIAISHKI